MLTRIWWNDINNSSFVRTKMTFYWRRMSRLRERKASDSMPFSSYEFRVNGWTKRAVAALRRAWCLDSTRESRNWKLRKSGKRVTWGFKGYEDVQVHVTRHGDCEGWVREGCKQTRTGEGEWRNLLYCSLGLEGDQYCGCGNCAASTLRDKRALQTATRPTKHQHQPIPYSR